MVHQNPVRIPWYACGNSPGALHRQVHLTFMKFIANIMNTGLVSLFFVSSCQKFFFFLSFMPGEYNFNITWYLLTKAPEEITAVVETCQAHILIVFIVFLFVGIFVTVSHIARSSCYVHNKCISSAVTLVLILWQPELYLKQYCMLKLATIFLLPTITVRGLCIMTSWCQSRYYNYIPDDLQLLVSHAWIKFVIKLTSI